MITKPMDVSEQFPIRKSKKQKEAFREAVTQYVTDLGYDIRLEKGSLGAKNIVIGNAETARYVVSAHYDTPACMVVPNFLTPTNPVTFIIYQLIVVALLFAVSLGVAFGVILLTDNFEIAYFSWFTVYFGILILMMAGPANKNNFNDNTSGVVTVLDTLASMPEEYREKVAFVLFDLEEAGLVGSSAYRKAHKKTTDRQIIINLDCVGDGDELYMFPTPKLRRDAEMLAPIENVCASHGEKSLNLKKKGFYVYPSDQKNFPYGLGVAAFHRNKLIGLYCDRIHTVRDTVLETENVRILKDSIIKIVAE